MSLAYSGRTDVGHHPALDELRATLRERVADLAETLLGRPSQRSRRELRWGSKGSLKVEISGPHAGRCYDFEADEGGDSLWLIQHTLRRGFTDAVRWAAGWAGIGFGGAAAPETEAERKARLDALERARITAERERHAEHRRRVSTAQFVADNAVEIHPGDLADTYLTVTRRIPRPEAGWPADVRFLPASDLYPAAVVFVARGDTGRVAGVQKINIDYAAQKIGKVSLGVFAETNAVIRLPGMQAGPVLVAEGPETGLSAWTATGHETWVVLGQWGNIPAEAGRQLVLLRDDDPQSSPADKKLRRAVATLRRAGMVVSVASPHECRRYNKSDLNDVIQAAGIEAVRARIEAALTVPQQERVSVDAARDSIRTVVATFSEVTRNHLVAMPGDPIPVLGAKHTVGGGKSTISRSGVISLMAELRRKAVTKSLAILVPTHRLSNEAAASFNAEATVRGVNVRAAIWHGRSAKNPADPNHQMCRDLVRVHDAMAAGTDIEKSCCRRVMDDGTVIECPFFRQCGYQAQKTQRGDVWFGAHELLLNERPSVMGGLAGLVVDEPVWQAGITGIENRDVLAIETLRNAPTPGGIDGQRLQLLRGLLYDVLETHALAPLSRAAFSRSLLTADMAAEAGTLEWRLKRDVQMHPAMSRQEYEAAKQQAEGNRLVRRLAGIWKAVAALLADNGPQASGWLTVQHETTREGVIRVLRIKGRKAIRKGWEVPTLLLDAILEPELARFYFPNLEVVADIEAETPHQRIIQVTGRTYSKRYFFEDRMDTSHLGKLAATLGRFSRNYAPRRVLVVAQKEVRDWLECNGRLPANLELAHYNAIAGLDQWGPKLDDPGVAALLCIGRVLPAPNDVEDMAEALSGAAVPRLSGWYEKRQVTRTMADGTPITAEVDFHPHPLCEAIRRDICEGQLTQSIGRGRGINRTADNALDIWMFGDATTDLPITQLVAAEDLDPGPVDWMLAEGGFALSNSAHVAALFDRWKTDSAVRSAFKRQAERSVALSHKDSSRGDATLLPPRFQRVEYQVAGSGNKVWPGVFDLSRIPDPRAFLTARLGELSLFRVVPEDAAQQPPEAIRDAEQRIPALSLRQAQTPLWDGPQDEERFWLDPDRHTALWLSWVGRRPG